MGYTMADLCDGISIHAPHEGERLQYFTASSRVMKISIHAPHEGERRTGATSAAGISLFQSTLPTRGSDHA